MISESILEKIKQRGYWKVKIRPLEYPKQKIGSLSILKEIIKQSQVSYRGWPFPLVKEIVSGENYIWDGADWQNHIEYWRLYQSAQYLHYFSMREDWEDLVEHFFGGKIANPRKPGSNLEIISSLYTITEIFEFTSQLIKKAPFESGIKISIDLVGTNNRMLFFYDIRRSLNGDYICKIPNIIYEKEFSFDDFRINSKKYAIECCVYIFEKFNWDKIPSDFLVDEQKKFLGKK